MKKIINVILIIIMSFLSSCKINDSSNEESNNTSNIEMYVNYDYGNLSQNKATLLYNGCLKFFDEKDYDLDTILAGDILKVSHTGSMQVALSYPGQVKLSNGKITNIEKIESIKVLCSVYQVHGEDENYREVVSDDKNINLMDIPSYVITSLDGSYTNISNISHGSKLIATVNINDIIDEKTYKVSALYIQDIL